MPRALISVSDKRGVAKFAKGLTELGWEIISTAGTARVLVDAGITITPMEKVTGFPEMLDGRVKTLHPAVHAGLLARRDVPEHMEALRAHDITPIDIVAVNLYPFPETVADPNVTLLQAIEQIDIGGPSMLRSAAKNHSGVLVVVDPGDYDSVLSALQQDHIDDALRQELPKEPTMARAHRGANRHLFVPVLSAREKKIGDVRAGDEQHEAHRPEEHEQRRPHVADDLLLKLDEVQRVRGGRDVAGRDIVRPALHQDVELPRRRLYGRTLAESPNEEQVVRSVVRSIGEVEPEGHPDFSFRFIDIEVGRHDPDHVGHRAVDVDRAADDLGISPEGTQPEFS